MMTIDGLSLQAPCILQVGYESVGRTETTADGAQAADRIALKRRVRVVWRGLGRTEAVRVLEALTRGVFMTATLPDPLAGDALTMTVRLVTLETELAAVDAAGRPETCQAVTAVLRER